MFLLQIFLRGLELVNFGIIGLYVCETLILHLYNLENVPAGTLFNSTHKFKLLDSFF